MRNTPDHANDNGRVREKQDFGKNKDDAEHEEGDHFPTGQPSQIVPEEKERKTNRRHDSRARWLPGS